MKEFQMLWMGVIAATLLLGCGTSQMNYGNAAVICQELVKEKLKSPSTAKFPSLSESKPTETENGFQWSSYVDAQNVFGATLRTQFSCTLNSKSMDIKRNQADVTVAE